MSDREDIAPLVERIRDLERRRTQLGAAVEQAKQKLGIWEQRASTLERVARDLEWGRAVSMPGETLSIQPSVARGLSAAPVPVGAFDGAPCAEAEDQSQSIEGALARQRLHLAERLHDGLTQELTSLVLALEGMYRQAEKDPGMLLQPLGESSRTARACLTEVRRLLTELRTGDSASLQLPIALQGLVEDLRREWGMSIHFASSWADAPVPREVELGILGTIREALTNARKHSGAAVVVLALTSTADAVEATVFDDGCGFDYQTAEEAGLRGASYGLVSMRQRITELGGSFHVTSSPGHGTRVNLRVPLGVAVSPP